MIIARDSTKPIYARVTATTPDLQPYDPTGDVIRIGFLADGDDVANTDWHVAAWVAPGTPIATLLVGPANGGVVVEPGTWRVRVQVSDNPAVPAEEAGWLTIP